MSRHEGARLGLSDPWFTRHAYTVRLHCRQWLRIYPGGWAELIARLPEEEEERAADSEPPKPSLFGINPAGTASEPDIPPPSPLGYRGET